MLYLPKLYLFGLLYGCIRCCVLKKVSPTLVIIRTWIRNRIV